MDNYEKVAAFVCQELPDSIRERKELLEALLFILPNGHPRLSAIRDSLCHLNSHEIAQRELALSFKSPTTTTTNDPK